MAVAETAFLTMCIFGVGPLTLEMQGGPVITNIISGQSFAVLEGAAEKPAGDLSLITDSVVTELGLASGLGVASSLGFVSMPFLIPPLAAANQARRMWNGKVRSIKVHSQGPWFIIAEDPIWPGYMNVYGYNNRGIAERELQKLGGILYDCSKPGNGPKEVAAEGFVLSGPSIRKSLDILVQQAMDEKKAELQRTHQRSMADERLMQVVAAYLSARTYNASISSLDRLTFSDQTIYFSTWRVLDGLEEDLGVDAKVAAVVANNNGEHILFLAFKGTNSLLQVLNWDFQHNHQETGEEGSFVHAGVFSLINQFKFFLSEEFIDLLQRAAKNGIKKLVLTGHSLGGMMAQALLHKLFRQWERFPLSTRQLIESVQVIAFGAPMTFGVKEGGRDRSWRSAASSLSPNFQAFQKYARERAVNFVNRHDPAPRAWSHFDLLQYVDEAIAKYDDLPWYKKFYLKPLGDAEAAKVWIRGNGTEQSDKIKELGKGYKQLAKLLILTDQAQFDFLKDFKQAFEYAADHSIDSYYNMVAEGSCNIVEVSEAY